MAVMGSGIARWGMQRNPYKRRKLVRQYVQELVTALVLLDAERLIEAADQLEGLAVKVRREAERKEDNFS